MFGAFLLSVLAAFWMARLLGNAGAYKQAFTVVLIATLGWCMPLFIQVFLLAGIITVGVQYWEEVKVPLGVWILAAGTTVAVGHMTGEQDLTKVLNSASAPADVHTSDGKEVDPVSTTP